MNRRLRILALAAGGLALLAAPAIITPAPRLLWNASASLPIGLYATRSIASLAVGDLVAVRPPEPLAALFQDRGYVPAGVPLLKTVRALPGAVVCRQQLLITIDDQPVGTARLADRNGRPLPQWQGCHRLQDGELFLLNEAPDSLDGRYFGPVPRTSVTARIVPLWTREAGTRRFQWRTSPSLRTGFPSAKKGSSHAPDR
jgi:conjugative transfer signal peptidase TraF